MENPNSNINVSTTTATRIYKYESINRTRKLQHNKFLGKCKALELIPNFARIRKVKNLNTTSIQKLEKQIIQNAIRTNMSNLNRHESRIYNAYQFLAIHLDPLELDTLIRETHHEKQQLALTMESRHNNKIRALQQQKARELSKIGARHTDCTNERRTDKYMNFTTYQLTTEEKQLLNKGHKYSSETYKGSDIENLAVELDAAILGHPNETTLRYDLTNALRNSRRSIERMGKGINKTGKKENKTLSELKQKLDSLNIICTTADKGAGMVLMEKTEYVDKTLKFLNDNGCTNITGNPLNTYIKKIRKTINKHNIWLTTNGCKTRNMIPMNPDIPQMYSQPKIHKDNRPVRPIVSAHNTPARSLGRFIANYLRRIYKPTTNYTLNNSIDLINDINKVKYSDTHIMVSFDVVNLYSSIPIQETTAIIKTYLENNMYEPNEICTIMEIINVVIEQNFFMFDNKIYKMEDGLPMGSPISAIMAEIFMNSFELKINNDTTNNSGISFWRRYVDDIIAVWDTRSSLNDFMTYINSLNHNIKFTLEQQNSEYEINFLNLTLKKTNNGIEHKIFRKATTKNIIIPYDSSHSMTHKIASFRYHIENIYKLKLKPEEANKEFQFICDLATEYGYPNKTIQRLRRDIEIKYHPLYTTTQNISTSIRYRNITYRKWFPDRIKRMLADNNIITAFTTRNKIINRLNNTKIMKTTHEKSGIYSISCEDCEAIYVGETGRSLNIRYKEHIKDQKSKVYRHMMINGHNMPMNNMKLLKQLTKCSSNAIYENMYIDRIKENDELLCLNGQTELSFDPIYKQIRNYILPTLNTTSSRTVPQP